MEDKTKQYILMIIPIIISVIALSISGWSTLTTLEIQDDTHKIQTDTYEAIEPFQKPIIYFHEGELKPSFSIVGNQYNVVINYDITFKNIGKGIAQNTTVKVFGTNYERPDEFKEFKNTSIINDLYPDMTSSVPVIFEFTEDALINGSTTYVIIIKTEFEDKVTKEHDSTTFWELYIWNDVIYHPSIEEGERLLPFLGPLI